ncbi:SHOCT domain-containing protein [Ornithinimicrobium pekingense]|uniref:SHOCT domain-containing protein n=1 Tax=Ornithinimicrobium pekingense TaxID=384677 RepID=A0ABQ2FB32_9MICO|nr:SHOCT domain-containing protein [Ornithinimicrobium pekingense]GGK70219.1 hypothetical protein GCM10011509_18330 [Ornithinimicrobium pekingense]
MRVDPSIPEDALLEVRTILARRLGTGERPLGVFAVSRLRRLVSYLVVTDVRLVTLGLRHQDHPVVDSVRHSVVEKVLLDRRSLLRSGEVRTRDTSGVTTYLGCLDPGRGGAALDLFESVVEQARSGTGAMTTIPTPAPPGPQGVVHGAHEGGPVGADPLPQQLGELARLHEEGLLTEDEFSAAKARLLGL